MIVTLQTQSIQTIGQMRAFVAGTWPVSFTLTDRPSAHACMAATLKRFDYGHASRGVRGVLRVDSVHQATRTGSWGCISSMRWTR